MLRSRMVWEKDNDGIAYAKIYDVPVIKKIENVTQEEIKTF